METPTITMALVLALDGREALAPSVAAHYHALEVPGVTLLRVAVGPGAAPSGWRAVPTAAATVAARWNAGVAALRDLRPDVVVPLLPSTLLDAAYVRALGLLARFGYDYVYRTAGYLFDEAQRRLVYAPGMPALSGLLLAAPVLDALGWQPFEESLAAWPGARLRPETVEAAQQPRLLGDLWRYGLAALEVLPEGGPWRLSRRGLDGADGRRLVLPEMLDEDLAPFLAARFPALRRRASARAA